MVQRSTPLFIVISITASLLIVFIILIQDLRKPANYGKELSVKLPIIGDESRTFSQDKRKIHALKQPVRRMPLEGKFIKTRLNHSEDHYHRRDVVKGTRTNSIDDYPYTVSLLNRNLRRHEWHTCGGTLIAPNIVLSAAHCKDHVKIVRIGHHSTDHVQRRLISKRIEDGFEDHGRRRMTEPRILDLDDNALIAHPDYDPITGSNDIMLIRLPQSFPDMPYPSLNSNKLVPNAYRSAKHKKVVVLGWGATEDGDPNSASEILLKANLEYVNNYQCGFAYGAEHITPDMLCAHSDDGLDACNGDSGGPLIMPHADGPAADLLVGVVSWGASCGSSEYPGVYARLSSAYKWINHVTCNKLQSDSCTANGEIRTFVAIPPPTPNPTSKPTKFPTSSPTEYPSSSTIEKDSTANTFTKDSTTNLPAKTPVERIKPSWCRDFGGRFYTSSKRTEVRDCAWVRSSNLSAMTWYRCRWFSYYCPDTCGKC